MAAVANKKGGFLDFFKNLFKRKERVSADAGERNNWKAWLYLAPVIILLSVFTFYPLINTVVIAFLKDYDYTTQVSSGFTFDNFLTVLTLAGKDEAQNLVYKWNCVYDSALGSWVYNNGLETVKVYFQTDVLKYALPNTMIITFVTVPLSIIIALLISVCLHSIKAFQKIFQTIFFVPYVTNAVAVGMVFAVLFDSQGILNYIFGLGTYYWIDQTATHTSAMFALCVYIIWHALPYKILIFLSALQNIDKQYYDAAKIDCAGKFKTFMNVTVPMLSPQILYIMITSFIGSFKEYTSVVGLIGSAGTGGTNNMYTIVYYVYDCLKAPTTVSRGAAAALMLFVIIMIFTAIQFQVSKRRVHY